MNRVFCCALLSGGFASCASPRIAKISNPPQTRPAASSPATGVWLTDGSLSSFLGTTKFPEVQTKGLFGTKFLRQPYEGLPDRIHAGAGTLDYTMGGFDFEAEFAVRFDRPLAALAEVTAETPVTVLGLMETKTLRT